MGWVAAAVETASKFDPRSIGRFSQRGQTALRTSRTSFGGHGRVEPTKLCYFEPIGLATKSFGIAKAHHLQARAVGEFDQQHECLIESYALRALRLPSAGEKLARGPHDLRALLADHRGRLLRMHL